MTTVYHYTVAPKIPAILKDGVLKRSSGFVRPPEKPAAWFSANNQWEASAAKVNGMTMKAFTLDEHVRLLGLCRFRTNTKILPTLHSFKDYESLGVLGMDFANGKSLLMAGVLMGAFPSEWWFTIYDVPVNKLTFEVPVPESNETLGRLYYRETDPMEFYQEWRRKTGTVLEGKMSEPGKLRVHNTDKKGMH